MPNLLQINRQYQDRLRNNESEAISRIQDLYLNVYQNLVREFEQLVTTISVLQLSGKNISKNYLYQSTRFASIITQLSDEMQGFINQTTDIISSSQRDAAQLAVDSTPELIKSAVGKIPNNINFDESFLRFDEAAAEQMVARFSDGSPIRESLERYVKHLIGDVETRFVQAIIKGEPARKLANDLYSHFGLSFVNAQTSARTNIISAYRDGNLERYRQTEIVKGWQWSATLDNRTCEVCIYMDGKEFDLDDPFATHPVCRCSPLPITKTWAELGIDAPEFKPDLGLRGEEWFRAQDDSVKLDILKKEKFKLYKAGIIELKDLVHYFEHPRYGPSREKYSILDLKRLKVLR